MDMGRLLMYDLWQSKRATEDFKTFNLEDLDNAFESITCLRYQQPTELTGKCKGITITASAAGHTVGGTVWRITKDTEAILYAVDYNHRKDKHLDGTVLLPTEEGKPPEQFKSTSLMITDAFNAGERHPPRSARDKALLESTISTLKDGGSVLLPTDSSTRVLELAYMLDSYWMTHRLPYPLILLTHFSYRTAHFATSMMEWMGDTVRAQLTETRENPFQFKYLRLCQRLADLDRFPGPRVVLASNLSMECGFAREVFLNMEDGQGGQSAPWSQNPKNTLILTERALPGELARYLYDEWKDALTNGMGDRTDSDQRSKKKSLGRDVGSEVQLDQVLQLKMDRKVLLQGQELADYMAAQEARLEREAADAALVERNRRALMEEGNDSDSESDSDDDDNIDNVGGGGVTGGGSGRTRSGGDHLTETDILLSKTGGHDDTNMDDADNDMMVDGTRENGADQDGNGGGNDGGKDMLVDEDMVHPEDNLPSKYVSTKEDVVVRCKVRYVDMEGRADESAMQSILQALAPRKLILVHGTEEQTEELCETYLSLTDMTREIYTPSVGEVLNVSEMTNMYKINLTDALLSSLGFTRLGEYDLAFMIGQVQIPTGSTAPVLGVPQTHALLPDAQGSGQAQQGQPQVGAGDGTGYQQQQQSTALQLYQQHQKQLESVAMARQHRPVFVGDVILTELRDKILKPAGIQAEFMAGGILVCNGVVGL
ncbi:cleavage and polyadenylation specificity factor subunit 2, partial [Lunasporangiospora selenospora]